MTGKLTSQGLAALIDSGKANFLNLAVGTGPAVTPTESLEALVAELDRNAVGTSISTGNMIVLGAIFGNGEANGTLKELGIFDGGDGMLLYEDLDVDLPATSAASKVCRVVIALVNA